MTFEPCSGFPVTHTRALRGVQTPADGGFVHRAQIAVRAERSWTLRWASASAQLIAVVQMYWNGSGQGVEPLLYVPPGESVPVEVHMERPPDYARRSASHGSLEVTLSEVVR